MEKETPIKQVELKDVYTPIGKAIVIEVSKDEKTKGGIIIPEVAMKKNVVCKVIATGKDSVFSIGDYVMVSPSCRPMIIPFVDPESHIQVYDHDIIGLIDKNYKELNIDTLDLYSSPKRP